MDATCSSKALVTASSVATMTVDTECAWALASTLDSDLFYLTEPQLRLSRRSDSIACRRTEPVIFDDSPR